MAKWVISGFVIVSLVLAGYIAPHFIWTKADAEAAVKRGTSLNSLIIGKSRVPCRGPNKGFYVFGYTLGITSIDMPTGGSGSVCWDVFNSQWAWRVDPPHDKFSSDRSPQSRGLK